MWKVWKKEIIGISLASVLGVCLIAGLIVHFEIAAQENQYYNTHVMLDGTLYWLEHTLPELPEGYEEFARVESEVSNRKAEQNGQAHGLAVGTPLYRSQAQPGCICIPAGDGRWNRLTVSELRKSLLRYGGMLYVSQTSVYEVDVSLSYEAGDFTPTGETLHFPGHYEILPTEDCTTNSSAYSGGEICLDPGQPDVLLVKRTRTQQDKTETDYVPFITTESLGLDYSVYEENG